VREQQFGSIIMLVAGAYLLIRAFRGKEFFLTGIGGNQSSKPVPNRIARPLMILFGVAAIALSIGLWFEK
jgi:hypothetical protein